MKKHIDWKLNVRSGWCYTNIILGIILAIKYSPYFLFLTLIGVVLLYFVVTGYYSKPTENHSSEEKK